VKINEEFPEIMNELLGSAQERLKRTREIQDQAYKYLQQHANPEKFHSQVNYILD
jgi:hypothetical protein